MSREEEDRLKLDFIGKLQGCGTQAAKIGRKRKKSDRETRGTPDYSQGYQSVALSVHSSQAKEFQEMANSAGLTGIKYDEKGKCHIHSRKHRKEFMKMRGMADFDGGYGD